MAPLISLWDVKHVHIEPRSEPGPCPSLEVTFYFQDDTYYTVSVYSRHHQATITHTGVDIAEDNNPYEDNQ